MISPPEMSSKMVLRVVRGLWWLDSGFAISKIKIPKHSLFRHFVKVANDGLALPTRHAWAASLATFPRDYR
jgi:hypothetical protein